MGEDFAAFRGYRGFVWQDGQMTELPGNTEAYAEGINARGDIAGTASTGGNLHATLWKEQ